MNQKVFLHFRTEIYQVPKEGQNRNGEKYNFNHQNLMAPNEFLKN